jgi:hypothetical protein
MRGATHLSLPVRGFSRRHVELKTTTGRRCTVSRRYHFSLSIQQQIKIIITTMAEEDDQDLVDYDEEEEEQNVTAEETGGAEGKETKK